MTADSGIQVTTLIAPLPQPRHIARKRQLRSARRQRAIGIALMFVTLLLGYLISNNNQLWWRTSVITTIIVILLVAVGARICFRSNQRVKSFYPQRDSK